MGRRSKLRASYFDDGMYLLRLEDAIMRDPLRPLEWRKMTAERVRELAMHLMTEPSVEPESAPTRRGSRRKAG